MITDDGRMGGGQAAVQQCGRAEASVECQARPRPSAGAVDKVRD